MDRVSSRCHLPPSYSVRTRTVLTSGPYVFIILRGTKGCYLSRRVNPGVQGHRESTYSLVPVPVPLLRFGSS